MTLEEIKSSDKLSGVILHLITTDTKFKNFFKASASVIAADIESASTNPSCSCRNKVINYVTTNLELVSNLLYEYIVSNNLQKEIENIFETISKIQINVSGKVAKTTIKDWPEFAKNVYISNLSFNYMSTSIVNDDVYVFFL